MRIPLIPLSPFQLLKGTHCNRYWEVDQLFLANRKCNYIIMPNLLQKKTCLNLWFPRRVISKSWGWTWNSCWRDWLSNSKKAFTPLLIPGAGFHQIWKDNQASIFLLYRLFKDVRRYQKTKEFGGGEAGKVSSNWHVCMYFPNTWGKTTPLL